MNTSRSQLDRLLDPANGLMSLETLTRAATEPGQGAGWGAVSLQSTASKNNERTVEEAVFSLPTSA